MTKERAALEAARDYIEDDDCCCVKEPEAVYFCALCRVRALIDAALAAPAESERPSLACAPERVELGGGSKAKADTEASLYASAIGRPHRREGEDSVLLTRDLFHGGQPPPAPAVDLEAVEHLFLSIAETYNGSPCWCPTEPDDTQGFVRHYDVCNDVRSLVAHLPAKGGKETPDDN